jgi:hypothetical protein
MLNYLSRNMWIVFVALAGLAWGTYVPLIFYGGGELGGAMVPPRPAARMLAILCVGVAYFLIGVIYPVVYLLRLPREEQPEWSVTGLIFSGLAGVAGAVGAICVVFGTGAAVGLARAEWLEYGPGGAGVPGDYLNKYKVFIAPLIFGLAPVINTLVSMIWHPKKGEPMHFGFHAPHWLLWVGVVLVGAGAAVVLYSKEAGEGHSSPTALLDGLARGFSGDNPWLLYVALAGLAWGTYVPLIFYGGGELGGKPSSRLLAILCVGVAYFVCAVLVPVVVLAQTPGDKQPRWDSANGLLFAALAGAAGAIGAICVIFATKSAVDSAKEEGRPAATYKLFIAPLIFGLAPVINTLVSCFWLPKYTKGETVGTPWLFGWEQPHWLLWVGIVAVGLGAALVLYSKELSEATPAPKPTPAPA